MNPNPSNDFLDSELDHLRVEMTNVKAPSNIETAVLNAFIKHQRTPAKLRSKQSWLTAFSQWIAPATALAASVVMGLWMSLSLLLPTEEILPVEITDAASQIDNAGRDNSAPFFALQSLEQISLEPNPRLIETRIPKMMLASMGVSVPPEMAAESLRAEMLVSAAGQPLALRFSQR
jgi:hypothetical protein